MAFLNETGLERLWTHILAKLGTKVDKVSGKGLSTNDYTDEDKEKLTNMTADDFGVYVQDTEPENAVDGDIWVDTANDPAYTAPTLPEVTEADNGKVLMVVNGKYQLVTLNLSTDASGVLSV